MKKHPLEAVAAALLLKMAGEELASSEEKPLREYCQDANNAKAVQMILEEKPFTEEDMRAAEESEKRVWKNLCDAFFPEQPQGGKP